MFHRLTVVLGVSALGFMLVSPLAGASHVRPKGATPFRASLVPAYKACATPNRTHGAPLAFPSCNPPVQESSSLTVGSPDANGAGANSVAAITFKVNPTASTMSATASISDVRCLPGTAAGVCNSPNAADGPDYSGGLQGNATIRISDHYNGPGLNEAATVIELPMPVTMVCANTTSTTTGGVCSIQTGTECLGCFDPAGNRVVVGISQFEVFDGGPDGQPSTAGNTVFMRQGIFIP